MSARLRPGLRVVRLRPGNTTGAALRERPAPHPETVAAALAAGEAPVEIR